MKKFCLFLLAVLMAAGSLTACAGGKEPKPSVSETTEEQETTGENLNGCIVDEDEPSLG